MLVVNTHRHLCSIIGLGPAKQAVEEIKGQPEKFAILWKRWTAERVERSENAGSWIGAVGTRKLDVHDSSRVTVESAEPYRTAKSKKKQSVF